MAQQYLSPTGEPCSYKDYIAFEDTSYTHHDFRDDKISIVCTTRRTVRDPDGIPPEHWMRFTVKVSNIITTDSEGQPLLKPMVVPDPDATKEFRSLHSAELHYNKLLLNYTESIEREDGTVKEVGNVNAPPDPDVPLMSDETDSSFGSW